MYSLRQLSNTCFRRPEYPWLYSGETTTSASALFILAEKSACLMASPASFVGRGSFAISIRSVSTPAHLPSSWVTSRAACRLMRPILAVPRITGMNKTRLPSMNLLLREVQSLHQCANGLTKYAQHSAPQWLSGLLYCSSLKLDDLAMLFRSPPLPLRRYETLRNIKWNQPRHKYLSLTQHQHLFVGFVI